MGSHFHLILSHAGYHPRRIHYARHHSPILTSRISNDTRIVRAMTVRLPLAAFASVILALFFASPAYSSTGAVLVGQSVTLSVSADGTAPFLYQWYKNSTIITGAAAATYSINSVQTTDAGSYYAIVSNSAGSTTSDTATLTVDTTAWRR